MVGFRLNINVLIFFSFYTPYCYDPPFVSIAISSCVYFTQQDYSFSTLKTLHTHTHSCASSPPLLPTPFIAHSLTHPFFFPLSSMMSDSPTSYSRQQRHSPNNGRHINFVWPSLDQVAYPRHDSGPRVPVAGPTDSDAITTIERHLLLKTASLDQALPLYKKCAQYEYRGGCEKGPLCKYVHAVHLDTTLTKRKRYRVASANASVVANTSQCNVSPGVLDASLTLCDTDCGDQKPIQPVLSLPTPSMPRVWWYRDPYSQSKIRFASAADATTTTTAQPINE